MIPLPTTDATIDVVRLVYEPAASNLAIHIPGPDEPPPNRHERRRAASRARRLKRRWGA